MILIIENFYHYWPVGSTFAGINKFFLEKSL